MTITVDSVLKARLLEAGVSTLQDMPFSLPKNSEFEPPCSIKWMNIQYYFALGAFSYAVNGYYFDCAIGRYTSIGENVQIGRGSHPVSWASTSPVFYHNHQDVVDFTIPEARDFSPTAPYIPSRRTTIGNDVYIGHGAFICQGVSIGDGAVIGAHTVVTKDVPSYAVVVGSPGTIKRMRFSDKVVEDMIQLNWWRFAFWDLQNAPVDNAERFVDFIETRIKGGLSEYRPAKIRLLDLIH